MDRYLTALFVSITLTDNKYCMFGSRIIYSAETDEF